MPLENGFLQDPGRIVGGAVALSLPQFGDLSGSGDIVIMIGGHGIPVVWPSKSIENKNVQDKS